MVVAYIPFGTIEDFQNFRHCFFLLIQQEERVKVEVAAVNLEVVPDPDSYDFKLRPVKSY